MQTTTPRSVSPDASLVEAASRMRDLGVSALPVRRTTSDGMRLGVITERDIACRAVAAGMDPARTKVWDLMTEAAGPARAA